MIKNQTDMKNIVFIAAMVFFSTAFYSCKTGTCADDSSFIYDSVNKITSRIEKIVIPDITVNIIEFSGHQPDETGSYDFRADIQKAIDEVSQKGGGKILFPHTEGKTKWTKLTDIYRLSGPIELRSNIELVFQPSVKLFFEFNPQAYSNNGEGVITRYEGTTIYGLSPLFRAFNVKNIVFSYTGGNGAMPEITGDGEKWVKWASGFSGKQKFTDDPNNVSLGPREANNNGSPIAQRKMADVNRHNLRPSMIQFFLCENILLDGVKLTNPPFWVVHTVFSKNMTFRNIFFDAGNTNNDGFDIESSKDVLIENIMFDNHDDNVVVKSGRDREGREGAIVAGTELEHIPSEYIKEGRIGGIAENIVARNCVFKGHHAFAVGSEASAGARNIYIVDNIGVQNVKMGVFIKSSRARGGITENIFIYNLKLNIVEDDVISINPNYDGDTLSPNIPQFRNIHIENVTVENAHNGIRVYGWQEKPTQDITLKNIDVQFDPGYKDNLKLDIINGKNIILKNVTIGGEKFEGTFTKKGPASKIPKQT
jgi:polygalacturonase